MQHLHHEDPTQTNVASNYTCRQVDARVFLLPRESHSIQTSRDSRVQFSDMLVNGRMSQFN